MLGPTPGHALEALQEEMIMKMVQGILGKLPQGIQDAVPKEKILEAVKAAVLGMPAGTQLNQEMVLEIMANVSYNLPPQMDGGTMQWQTSETIIKMVQGILKQLPEGTVPKTLFETLDKMGTSELMNVVKMQELIQEIMQEVNQTLSANDVIPQTILKIMSKIAQNLPEVCAGMTNGSFQEAIFRLIQGILEELPEGVVPMTILEFIDKMVMSEPITVEIIQELIQGITEAVNQTLSAGDLIPQTILKIISKNAQNLMEVWAGMSNGSIQEAVFRLMQGILEELPKGVVPMTILETVDKMGVSEPMTEEKIQMLMQGIVQAVNQSMPKGEMAGMMHQTVLKILQRLAQSLPKDWSQRMSADAIQNMTFGMIQGFLEALPMGTVPKAVLETLDKMRTSGPMTVETIQELIQGITQAVNQTLSAGDVIPQTILKVIWEIAQILPDIWAVMSEGRIQEAIAGMSQAVLPEQILRMLESRGMLGQMSMDLIGNMTGIPPVPQGFKGTAHRLMPVPTSVLQNDSSLMGLFYSVLSSLPPTKTQGLPSPYQSHNYNTPTPTMQDQAWNFTQEMQNCTDLIHMLTAVKNSSNDLQCVLQAFLSPLCWDALFQGGPSLPRPHFNLLAWGSQPLLQDSQGPLTPLPSQLAQEHVGHKMQVFTAVFGSLSPAWRSQVLQWVKPLIVQNLFNCSLAPLNATIPGSTQKQMQTKPEKPALSARCFSGLQWLSPAVMEMLGPFLPLLPTQDLRDIQPNQMCEFAKKPQFQMTFSGAGEALEHTVARRLLGQLQQNCPNSTQSPERLGSLVCFMDDLQSVNASVYQQVLLELNGCKNSGVEKLKRQLVEKMMSSGSVMSAGTLHSLGTAASSLSISQLASLSLDELQDALSTLAGAHWTPAQARTLAKKLTTNGGQVNVTMLRAMGSVIRGMNREVLQALGGALLRSGDLDILAKDMSTLQRAAVLEGLLSNASAALLLQSVSGPLLASVSLHCLQSANLSSAQDLQGKNWTIAQAAYLVKSIFKGKIGPQEIRQDPLILTLLFNLDTALSLSLSLSLTQPWPSRDPVPDPVPDPVLDPALSLTLSLSLSLTLSLALGSAVSGVTCEMIDSMNNGSALEMASALLKNSQWLSNTQLRCTARKLFTSLAAQRQGYFANITDAELRAIPPTLLPLLTPEQISSLPVSVCVSFLEKVSEWGNMTVLPRSSPQRPVLLRYALTCLGKNASTLTADDVSVLGPLLCELGPQDMSALPATILNTSLPSLAQCRQLRPSQAGALYSRVLRSFGEPSGWSLDMMTSLGPFLLLNDTALRSLPSQPWLKTALTDLLDAQPAPSAVPHPPEFQQGPDLTALRWKLYSLTTASATGNRRKREVATSPTVQQILDLGVSNALWSPAQLSALTPQVFNATVATLGTVTNYSPDQLTALRNKTVQVWGPLSSLSDEQVLQLGCVTPAFTAPELRLLSLSLDTLEPLAACNWTQAQREAMMQGFLEHSGTQAGKLGAVELVGLGQFVCGMSPEQVSLISSTSYRDAARVVGLVQCPLPVTEALKKLALVVFGGVKTWTEASVSTIGNVIAGLNASELQNLDTSVMPFVSRTAVPLIPPARLAALSANQLRALGPTNAGMVTEAQMLALGEEQQRALAEAVGVQFTRAATLPTTTTTTRPVTTATPLALKSGSSRLGALGIMALLQPLLLLLALVY
ncbi:stereocilin-like [Amia ocellicauda]|uniref:stereocilin-like n=1 Tax=Amia ocellicauda TaxID=2972642 RepID=UPI003464333E